METMTIETKFNINDIVFVLDRNAVRERRIYFIRWDSKNGVYYSVYVGDETDAEKQFHESKCFATKQELLNYL